MSPQDYFDKLFNKVSTIDNTPYCCIPAAIKFRTETCGGEANIREYCFSLAREGARRMAEILGTDYLQAEPSCCFATVRLPLAHAELGSDTNGRALAKWMQELTPAEYETYIPIKFYDGAFWCRISAQIYLALEDFEWATVTILEICQRMKTGEWKNKWPKVA
ncbi:selenocysteine lyase [Akanthomyces lecanii RCEF 1005]|uniref:Selenocysteine lyase n=1 Tax=Akanthomyces lecanii RCEF 1005 TaxID=1081108 RepID=A0A162K7N0_CORDF|nr:selenocysteine lyase [Akanthomyces lecanii RCEF 1005]